MAATEGAGQLIRLKKLPIISDILTALHKELPAYLCYHCASHTEEVLHDVVEFAIHDGLSEKEITLLAIAAAYHDAGFLEACNANEGVGARMAISAMNKDSQYSEKEKQNVKQWIEDTVIRVTSTFVGQKPSIALSGYLLDADMSNLGRVDFFEKAELVAKERGVTDMKGFWKDTMRLVGSKEWYTPAGRALRAAQHSVNLKELKSRVGE